MIIDHYHFLFLGRLIVPVAIPLVITIPCFVFVDYYISTKKELFQSILFHFVFPQVCDSACI